jgi:uncharacterized protein YdaU (DUF1376 family)
VRQYEETGQLTADTASAPHQPQPEKEADALASSHSKPERSPAFQFYPRDFLSSSNVQQMSLAEVGVYITLLSHAWLDGGLPDDVAVLARLVKMKQPQFAKIWANGPLSLCFTAVNGKLVNPRQERQRKELNEFKRKQRTKAELRWQCRRNATALPIVAVPGQCSSSSSSSSSASTANAVRRAPIHDTSHRKHAHCGRVCLPAVLFSEFVRRRNHASADREIRDWALAVELEWADGPRAGDEPGDPFDFWKARYAEKWPAAGSISKPSCAPVRSQHSPSVLARIQAIRERELEIEQERAQKQAGEAS